MTSQSRADFSIPGVTRTFFEQRMAADCHIYNIEWTFSVLSFNWRELFVVDFSMPSVMGFSLYDVLNLMIRMWMWT